MLIEVLFFLSICIIVYAFIGYGAVVYCLVKIKNLFARNYPEYDNEYNPSVSLIIPCYNEAGYIAAKLENSLKLDYPSHLLEIIAISDGSNDGTDEVIEKYTSEGIIAMHQSQRQGKAHAMNRAVRKASGEILIFCDANTELNKDCISKIVRHYAHPNIGGVAGAKKILIKDNDGASSSGEGFYWKYESFLKKMDSQLYSVVGAAGELMSFRKSLYQDLEPDTILDDFMQSMRICEKGFRVVYEPEAMAFETASANIGEELKRKIRIAAGGWQSLFRLSKAINPVHNSTLTFQYISHRVLRWVLTPFLLILVFLLNISLLDDGWIYMALFSAQLWFYKLALTGWILQKKSIKLKVVYIPYYFLVMNYAAIMGLKRHLSGNQSVLWERAVRAGV